MDPKLKPIISFIVVSFLLIVISIPLIIKKIPPNCVYGFRIKKTLANREIWYKANTFGGISLLVSALFILISCVVLLLNKDRLSFDAVNSAGLGLFLAPILVSLILTLAYTKKL